MSRRTPTRIELHRLKYHWSGGSVSPIPFDDLDLDECKILGREIFTNIYLNGGKDYYNVYAQVLQEWGVSCSHPTHMRRYPKHSRWYDCGICRCAVVTKT